MMKGKKMKILGIKQSTLLALLYCATTSVSAFAPTNFFVPYDVNLQFPYPPRDTKAPLRIGANIEWGDTENGYDWNAHKKSILQLHDDTQSTIAMLLVPTKDVDAKIGTLLEDLTNALPGQPLDDGVRGHIRLAGDFQQIDLTPHVHYSLPLDMFKGKIGVGLYLPVRYTEVYDITKSDITEETYAVDYEVKKQLTTVIDSKIKALGGPDLGSWSRTGLGDLVLMFDWYNCYTQTERDSLKDVYLHAKVGLTFPTGEEKDEDKAFSVALGNDGAWGIPFGIGLDLYFKQKIAFGIDAEFLVLFDQSKTRRLKTEQHQTEFFLLNKGNATKDYGLTWKFNAYLQAFRFLDGLSLKFDYEYFKHDDDKLTPKSDDFSASIVNSATSLKEYNSHNLIFQLNYDFFQACLTRSYKPQLSLFYKLPVGGKNVINAQTVGGQLAISF